MTRPRYETQADRSREQVAADKFAAHYPAVTVKKMDKGAFADFEIVKDGVVKGYMEVKTRRCASTQYATYHVAKAKLTTLQAEAEKAGVRAILLVQWTDAVGWIDVNEYLSNCTFTTGGRWDRNDPHDIETMAEVAIGGFWRFL